MNNNPNEVQLFRNDDNLNSQTCKMATLFALALQEVTINDSLNAIDKKEQFDPQEKES
jgi:hypothetical protein